MADRPKRNSFFKLSNCTEQNKIHIFIQMSLTHSDYGIGGYYTFGHTPHYHYRRRNSILDHLLNRMITEDIQAVSNINREKIEVKKMSATDLNKATTTRALIETVLTVNEINELKKDIIMTDGFSGTTIYDRSKQKEYMEKMKENIVACYFDAYNQAEKQWYAVKTIKVKPTLSEDTNECVDNADKKAKKKNSKDREDFKDNDTDEKKKKRNWFSCMKR